MRTDARRDQIADNQPLIRRGKLSLRRLRIVDEQPSQVVDAIAAIFVNKAFARVYRCCFPSFPS